MKKVRMLVFSGFLLTNFGCSSSDIFKSPEPGATKVIRSCEVTGTSEPISGVVPINAGVDEGSFTVAFELDPSVLVYNVTLHVSKDGAIGPGAVTGVKFFEAGCGPAYALCNTTDQLNCKFTNDNLIYCDQSIPTTPGANLTDFLDQLPQDLFLVMRACPMPFGDCETENRQIQLQ